MGKLKIGDVILLTEGDKIRGNIPQIFLKEFQFSQKSERNIIEIGKIYKLDTIKCNQFIKERINKITETLKQLDSSSEEIEEITNLIISNTRKKVSNMIYETFHVSAGEFVITRIFYNENIPHYICQYLFNGKYYPNSDEYSFCTKSGSIDFIKDIIKLRSMTPTFI